MRRILLRVVCSLGLLAGSDRLPHAVRAAAQSQQPDARALAARGEASLAAGRYEDAARDALKCAGIAAGAALAGQEIACLTIIGRARVYQGQYSEAATVLTRAALLARGHSLPESEAAAWNDVGSVRYYLGDYTESHACFNRALAVLEGQKDRSWYPRVRQVTIANLAMIEQRLGQFERALEMYLSLEAGAVSMRPSEHGRLLSNIGALYRRLGDPYKAIERYKAAEELFRRQHDHDGEIGVVTNLGIALAMDLEDLNAAITAFERAERLARESGNRRETAEAAIYASETLRRLARYPEAKTKAGVALAIGKEIQAPEEIWKAMLSLGKNAEAERNTEAALANYREAIGVIEQLRSGIAAVSMRAAFLGDKTEAYDGAVRMLLRGRRPDPAELFRYMEQGRARTLRDRLQGEPLALSAAQSRVPEHAALAEYWRTTDSAAVLWITRQEARLFPLEPVPEAAVEALTSRLRAGTGDWETPARELGRILLGRLPLDGIRHLIVAADRRLQAIPFETLPVDGANRLLVDQAEVSYLPAASMLPARSEQRGWLAPWRRMLTAFAFHGARSSTGPFGEILPPLPEAPREICEVAGRLGGRVALHSDSDNLKRHLTLIAAPPVLHFATHGIADPDDPDRSRLAFSSANDGAVEYLFAREIFDLKLAGVRLATLAACDTEGGKPVGGEGVAALSRAFLAAGAKATVSSLWRVSDRSSVEFMRRFYSDLAKGETASAALRSAKLELRRSVGHGHPRFWAPYVLNGDAQARTPRPTRLLTGIGGAALAAGVALLTRLRLRQKGSGTNGVSPPLAPSA